MMLEERERYLSPVGFASEPAGQWRKLFGRAVLLLLVFGVAWILWVRVVHPPSDNPQIPTIQEELPGPI